MANSRRRLTRLMLMLALCVLTLVVLASSAYATSWWSEWKDYGNDYSNRAAVTIYDSGAGGGVTGATQIWHVVRNIDGCAIHAKLYSGDNLITSTGWVDTPTMADENGRYKITTTRYWGYMPDCFGWGNTETRGGARWSTHQSSRHDYP